MASHDSYRAAVSAVCLKFRHVPNLLLMEGGYDSHHTPALRVDIKYEDKRTSGGMAWSKTHWIRPTTDAAALERALIAHVAELAAGGGHLARAAQTILPDLRYAVPVYPPKAPGGVMPGGVNT